MIPSRASFLGALAAVAVPAAVRAQSAETLRVGCTANDTYAEAYYALDQGFFKKAGVNVELTTLTNGATVAQAVASGALDAGISNQVQLATAIQKGIPFVLVAGGGLYATSSPTTALAVAKNATVKSAREFEGKTVGVSSLKDLSYVATVSWFEQNGADPAKVRFLELPFAQMGVSLERGTVAGAVISEPSLSAAEHGPAKLFAKAYDAIAKQFMISAWFTTQDGLRKNPDALRRFTAAIYEAARWANANKDASGAILARVAKLDTEAVRGMARCSYAENLDPKLIQPSLDLAYKFKLLERPIAAAEMFARAG